jgi:hypothetical protein
MTIDDIVAEFIRLPAPGTPAADLTDRDRVALAHAAGVPCELVVEGLQATFRTKVPVGVADRGDGGYLVYRLEE